MAIDILIFAVLAVVLAFRLRQVLGQDEGVVQKNQPVVEKAKQDIPAESPLKSVDRDLTPEEEATRPIWEKDPNFDVKEFLKGAEQAYEMVLHGFVAGQKKPLKQILHKDVLVSFEEEIDARKKNGYHAEHTLIKLPLPEILSADVKNDVAQVRLKFYVEQVMVVRDKKDQIVEGDEKEIIQSEDEWVLERDLKSENPNWIVVEIV